ncbi:MAG: hypothetical protein OJJ54_11770 [Pseudonocardia sp.]|nr:hypothetical protein [Pseudonocardia sp.]
MQLDPHTPAPHSPPSRQPSALAEELLVLLGRSLRIVTTPMPDAVARLDTGGSSWVLYLDSTCPAEDQCWALLDVLRVLELGSTATHSAIPAPRLRLPGGSG